MARCIVKSLQTMPQDDSEPAGGAGSGRNAEMGGAADSSRAAEAGRASEAGAAAESGLATRPAGGDRPGGGSEAGRYWQERLEAHPGLEGVGYLGLGRRYNAWLYRVRRQVFLRALRSLDLPMGDLRVVDVGSGTGFYVDLLQRAGARGVEGVDIAEAAVSRLERRFPNGRFHCLDIAAGLGPLSEGGFDLVTCCDVLFHVVDDRDFERAVGNLARLLADDGTLILMDNLLPGPTRRTAHQTSRSESHYLRTLSDAGLELRRRRPVFCLMNYPVASRRTGLRRLWSAAAARLSRAEVLAWAVGAALYPLELACLACLGRTGGAPSTELLVCARRPRRPSGGAGVVATGPG